ncbi:trypsin-like peptidase domain-containing protein [Streptomyces sp. NBC_01224]|uniref:nSTAND1 domain-containing NTPase n=1 Tax=Streptomyces sp. NBC_01224 TaxID=2903783 RepID=UPI002E0DD318|nr:trypsin-like peptidase domain-containing protein [Streptomyces sp. NBC_01224]
MQAAVAQVLSVAGAVAGAAFLTAEGVVFTCAHVVRDAGYGPGDVLRLRFPQAAGAPQAEGEVLAEPWRAPEGNDVAVIRLQDTPSAVHALEVGSSAGCQGHRVRCFGFPNQAPPAGHFGYAVSADLLSTGGDGELGDAEAADDDGEGLLLQLTAANDLTRGFSGGPVVDDVTGLVIGMVNAITTPDGHLRGQDIAYATPTQILRRAWPDLAVRQVCPYLGLEPLTAEHAAWFHGRDTAKNAVVAALAGQRRILLLLGPSGSGKSSLIQAGFLPELPELAELPGSDRWQTILVPRPGEDLAAELERQGLADATTNGLVAAVQNRLAADPTCERLLLVIDQFEELLARFASSQPTQTRQQDETESTSHTPKTVLDQLTSLVKAPVAATVILIMRDDFYPHLAAQAPDLLEAAAPGLLNVPATLSRQDLHAIITEPARAVGLRLEGRLTERIIRDVLAADPRAATGTAPATLLTPLQLTLQQLCEPERCPDGLLTHAAYERVGQITGALTSWCNAAVNELPSSHRDTARRILTALVRPADPARQIPATRQQVPLDTLRDLATDTTHQADSAAGDTADAVLAALAGHRIITTHARDPGPPPAGRVAELIHDILIRDWGDLREWVALDRKFHTWVHRAEGQRTRWNQHPNPDDLLHGTDLAEGVDWSRKRGLPSDIAEFVDASRRNQQAALRRTRRLNTILVGSLIVVLIAAGLAFWQRQTAVEAQQRALSRQFAAQSSALIRADPDLASLLAIEAYRTSHTGEASQSLYAAAAIPLKRRITAQITDVNGLALSPDGHTVATGSADGTVERWDVATGRARRAFTSETDPHGGVYSVAFSPDGRILATGRADGTVELRDAATGATTRVFLTHHTDVSDAFVSSMAFSPDGRTIATRGDDGTVELWDAGTGHSRTPLVGHADNVLSVAFSPDSRTLATGGTDGKVRLWDVATGRTRTTITGTGTGTGTKAAFIESVAFSPDGRTLAIGDFRTVRLWDVATGRTRTTLTGLIGDSIEVAFSPDGRTLATGGSNEKLQLWDVATGLSLVTLTDQSAQPVAFSPDGRTLATRSGRTIALWDVATSRTTLTGLAAGTVAFSPDGRTLATGGADKNVLLWDVATDRTRTTLTGHREWVSSVAFSPDGRTLADMRVDGKVQLWDVATGRTRTTLTALSGSTVPVVFSPDSRTLAGGDDSYSTVKLWDVTTGRTRTTFTADTVIASVAFSPDGSSLATGDTSGTVKLWDVATGHPRTILTGRTSLGVSVAFSPDGHTLATGSNGGTVRLWDVGTGRIRTTLATLAGYNAWGVPLAFSPDGRTLATGSHDGTVRLWDLTIGQIRTALTGHRRYVESVAFSPDGRTLATASRDGTVRLWDVDLPDQTQAIKKICEAVGRNLTARERAEFLPGQPTSRQCPP